VCQEFRDGISVHAGIWAAAVKMDERCLHIVERAMLDRPGWPLVILGHSLGAGTATLLGLRWRSRGLFPGFKVSRSRSLSLARARALSLPPPPPSLLSLPPPRKP
jgi:putative lipase involved disintegration of autophagic bodies